MCYYVYYSYYFNFALTTVSSFSQQEQLPCEPIIFEFGNPILSPESRELMGDPEMHDVAKDVVINLEATYAPDSSEMGGSAAAAIKALGCVVCSAGVYCPVKPILEHNVAVSTENRRIARIRHILSDAPAWLKAARLHKAGIKPEELQLILADREAMGADLATGRLDSLMGDVVANERIGSFSKKDLPELANINVPVGERFVAYDISTKTGNRFIIVDAPTDIVRNSLSYGGQEYGILCTKFVGLLNGVRADGSPLIMNPESTMQKPIVYPGSTRIYEIRMSGKNRLYISITKLPESSMQAARIVILGGHRGDGDTQKNFTAGLLGREH